VNTTGWEQFRPVLFGARAVAKTGKLSTRVIGKRKPGDKKGETREFIEEKWEGTIKGGIEKAISQAILHPGAEVSLDITWQGPYSEYGITIFECKIDLCDDAFMKDLERELPAATVSEIKQLLNGG
jgi:hypothetical protein